MVGVLLSVMVVNGMWLVVVVVTSVSGWVGEGTT